MAKFQSVNGTQTKLTPGRVRQIRRKYTTGRYTMREIGEQFGVARNTVGDIVRGTTWTNID